ncbi:MAG: hypothetical protein ACK4KT_06415 [Thermaurantimonas sp.]
MKNKEKNLFGGALAAATLAALTSLNAKSTDFSIFTLGTGAEVRTELLTGQSSNKFLNDLRCGESKASTKKSGKKAKTSEGKCGEAKCGESKTKTSEAKCGEAKCGESKTQQPK